MQSPLGEDWGGYLPRFRTVIHLACWIGLMKLACPGFPTATGIAADSLMNTVIYQYQPPNIK